MTVCMPVESPQVAIPRERVELVLAHLDQLPTLPAVAARLLAVTSSDESCVDDVAAIIETDAAMTAALLRMVRRADLGVRSDTLTVRRAVSLLGFTAVRNAVLSIQFVQTFPEPDARLSVPSVRRELWRHNLGVACAAELIGERLGGTDLASEAFVCGLLHDIGKVALDASLPKTHARVRELVERRFACICDVETELLGLDHTVAGRHLAIHWNLPQSIVECAWLHHQAADALPSSLSCPRLVQIVNLADNLVRREGIGYSGYQYISDVYETADRLGLASGDVEALVQRLPGKLATFAELVGLDGAFNDEAYAASLAAANRQLGQLNAKLAQAQRALEIRSECLAAVERFSGGLRGQDRIADVCASAAGAVRSMLGASRALAFHVEPKTRCLSVGLSLAGDGHHAGSTQAAETVETGERGPVPTIPPARGFVPGTGETLGLWSRYVGPQPHEPLWLLPLSATDGTHGAVVVAASEHTMSRYLAAPDGCGAMGTAIGHVLSSAAVRLDAERISEELLDLNRRLRAAQSELVRNRTVSMLAAMAAGAAHEMNNPLAVISGRAQMELGRAPEGPLTRTFEIIVEQTRKATQIVNDLMQYAKPGPPTPIAQPLGELLETLCQHWREELAVDATQLAGSVDDPAVQVFCDTMQLREILDAVVRNAVEATEPETRLVKINSPSRASDETVRIAVEDNGVGMTREVLEHAIDPFFSSRPAGRGRGLGLSRAHRLTEVNGGRLWLSSRPGQGTTVSIELPARAPGT